MVQHDYRPDREPRSIGELLDLLADAVMGLPDERNLALMELLNDGHQDETSNQDQRPR